MLSLDKINYLEIHVEQKIYNHRKWLGEFCEKGTGTFPYSAQGNPCVMSKTVFEYSELNVPLEIDARQDKPSYVVLMPAVRPDNNDPAALMQKICMIRDQAFGNEPVASRDEVKKRIAIVLGVNEFLSPDSHRNESFYPFIQALSNIEGVAFRALGFFWTRDLCSKWNSDKLYGVHDAYRILKNFLPLKAQEIAAEMKGDKIPYQQIRETIKNSASAKSLSALFQQNAPQSPLYVMTMDSDFHDLRSNRLGLFSHLDALVQKTVREKGFLPDAMTTGYRAPENAPMMTQLQVELDMRTREVMNQIVPGSAYMPEPCMGVRLAAGRCIRQLSYKGAGMKVESRRLIENGIANGSIQRIRMVFSTSGPVTTDVGRMITGKARSINLVTKNNISQKQVLESLAGVSQSHACANQWADNLYLALPITASVARNCCAPLKKIHNVFNPVELMFLVQSSVQEKYKKEHFQKALRIHERLTAAIAADDAGSFPALAEEIYPGSDIRKEQCLQLFHSRLSDCKEAMKTLSDFGLDDVWLSRCILAARMAGNTKRMFIERFQ